MFYLHITECNITLDSGVPNVKINNEIPGN